MRYNATCKADFYEGFHMKNEKMDRRGFFKLFGKAAVVLTGAVVGVGALAEKAEAWNRRPVYRDPRYGYSDPRFGGEDPRYSDPRFLESQARAVYYARENVFPYLREMGLNWKAEPICNNRLEATLVIETNIPVQGELGRQGVRIYVENRNFMKNVVYASGEYDPAKYGGNGYDQIEGLEESLNFVKKYRDDYYSRRGYGPKQAQESPKRPDPQDAEPVQRRPGW